MKTLLKAGIKKQWQSILSLMLLFTIMTVAVEVAASIYVNSQAYVEQEMTRLGYGDMTYWVSEKINEGNSGENDTNDLVISELESEIDSLADVERVDAQKLIYSGYQVGEQRSDNEGQMILYEPEQYAYQFLDETGTSYVEVPEITAGTIYVSPAMASGFHAQIGDTLIFRLSRNGITKEYTIAGYFEDPFMGSSMIDMKSFLIGDEDYYDTLNLIHEAGSFQGLARGGAMLHVFQTSGGNLSSTDLGSKIQSNTQIGNYMEFSYSRESIRGFMLILQNIMKGFLMAFAVILSMIELLILGHSIGNSIEQDYRDMGILKTAGCTSARLRSIQLTQYISGILTGIVAGTILSGLIDQVIEKQMVYSTGLLIPGKVPFALMLLLFLVVLGIFSVFIWIKTARINQISPIQAMRGMIQSADTGKKVYPLRQTSIVGVVALRQIQSNRKRYVGTAFVAFLLVSLIMIVGKMNQWMGNDGKGLMDSFSVAEHDLGVQPNHAVDMKQVEAMIGQYADIEETYQLAMPAGTVENVGYTINVLDEPEWFHIVKGRTCRTAEEILVTEYVASDLDVQIGDVVTAGTGIKKADYTIVGIYACANGMGANVGMTREGYARIGNVDAFIWCHHYVLSDSAHNEEIMTMLQNTFPMDMDVHTNSWSGLDGIVSTMKLLTIVMYGIVFVVIIVVVILTSSKLIQLEQRDMAIYKSLGMTSQALRYSYMMRFGMVSMSGSLLAAVTGSVFADRIVEGLLGSFGISDFHTTFSVMVNVGMPAVVILLFALTAYLYAGKIKRIEIMRLIREE